MIAEIGWIALAVSFFLTVYAAGASAWGGRSGQWAWVHSARNAAVAVFPLLTISVAAVVISLLALDFRLAYVVEVSSRAMSPFLRTTALWGGQQGSILFWAWLMSGFVAALLGPAFFLFIGLTFLGSMGLLFRRLDDLKAEHELESLLSREAAFLLQNVLFLAITFAVFWGTVFPLISELVTATKITVGPPYFKKVTGPLFSGLIVLMGLAPWMAWRRQGWRALARTALPVLALSLLLTGVWAFSHRQHPASLIGLWLVTFVGLAVAEEFAKGVRARMRARSENPLQAAARLIGRNRRRYGGYIVHLGVLMIALAFVGDAYFKQETQGTIGVGEQLTVGGYSVRFEGLDVYPGSDGREVVEATARLFRGGRFLTELKPRRDYFIVQQQPVTVPAVYSTPGEDVYVLLVGWEEIGFQSTTFKIYVNPLINWAWIGALALIGGILIAVWPGREAEPGVSYRLRPAPARPVLSAGD